MNSSTSSEIKLDIINNSGKKLLEDKVTKTTKPKITKKQDSTDTDMYLNLIANNNKKLNNTTNESSSSSITKISSEKSSVSRKSSISKSSSSSSSKKSSSSRPNFEKVNIKKNPKFSPPSEIKMNTTK